MKTVDVVIPVHNAVHWLAWCLEELFRFDSVILVNVFVVNDRSEYDQSKKIEEILNRFKRVTLINNEGESGGFGYACNLGVSQCTSDLVLFLNTDCLMTDGVLEQLSAVFSESSNIALACPLSNNSPALTYPMYPGRSYRDMAEYCKTAITNSDSPHFVEACTVIGNCLMVRRDFFIEVEGFSSEWGVGYGEETDLHMKALERGLQGVVHLGCYVYHYGGGTFNYENGIQKVRDQNHKLFMSKWSRQYEELARRCEASPPLEILNSALYENFKKTSKLIELDVLFYLPGINQGIGGLNAVVAICNDLIKAGIKASCALIGVTADVGLAQYKEPVLFNFLYFVSDNEFLQNRSVLSKVVISTIHTSAQIVARYALDRNSRSVQFVQGYEGYFENGLAYPSATDSYACTEQLITTSNWLAEMIMRHLSDSQTLIRLPLVVNQDIFFPGNAERKFDLCFILRSAPDKGQWLLCEILDRVVKAGNRILVLHAPQYSHIAKRYGDSIKCVSLPLDQYSIATYFRTVRVIIDASSHEGYGLLPLEAALCGCRLVVSDSGGVRDFVSPDNGELVLKANWVSEYITAIERQLKKAQEHIAQVTLSQLDVRAWEKYLINLTANDASPSFRNMQETDTCLTTVPSLAENRRTTVTDFAKRLYRYVRPHISNRLHMAIKVLITGKV